LEGVDVLVDGLAEAVMVDDVIEKAAMRYGQPISQSVACRSIACILLKDRFIVFLCSESFFV
jgi:hypothetical protein